MKKRIISIILALIMSFSFSVEAFAAESRKTDNRIESYVEAKINASDAGITVGDTKTLLDFAGNEYKLVECNPTGYYIIHPESGIIVEYAIDSKSPYAGLDSNLYYGGPTYYYVKSGDKYSHTVLNAVLDNNKLDSAAKDSIEFNKKLISQANKNVTSYFNGKSNLTTRIAATANGTDYWVESYTWLENLRTNFGYVDGGYCGYIAANLILKYWNYRGNVSLKPPYNTTNSTALTNKLIDIGSDLGYGSSTWALSISNVINKFCSQQTLPEEANWAIGTWGITTEIGTNKRPCILFCNLAGAGNHAVVAYGYNGYENSGYDTFICNYGWDGNYSAVHVYGGTSIFGSNTKYKV